MILSCGEALIDMLPRETTKGEAAFAPYPGGALFNTALALGRLGLETGFVSGLSTDLFGQMLVETLAKSNVSVDLSQRSPRPTTLAFVSLKDGQASYAFYDENTALRLLTPADVPSLPAKVQAMVFGCISLVGQPCADFYEELLAQNAGDKLILIDPNIRAGFVDFVGDEAGYRARLDRMMARADIVKMSDEDMHWLMGAGPLDEIAAKLLAMGPKLVVVTQGSKGITGWTKDGKVNATAPKIAVADTVGAGDTVNAGILAGLDRLGALSKAGLAGLDDQALRGVLSLAARAAAITCSRPGANPPWANELA